MILTQRIGCGVGAADADSAGEELGEHSVGDQGQGGGSGSGSGHGGSIDNCGVLHGCSGSLQACSIDMKSL